MASPDASAHLSTELFTEALAITHSGTACHEQRVLAEEYLMSLRLNAQGLNLAFHIISNEGINDIRCFWAFNTVMHHLPQISPTMDAHQSMQIYATLSGWFHRCSKQVALQDFLLNKHAQLMVVGVQEFFPSRWNSFFSDLMQMLQSRDVAPPIARDQWSMYFLRIFEYIDERVVCVRGQSDRSREQRNRDMQVKDAMREFVIGPATAAWYALLCEYRQRNPDVTRVCLSVVACYVEWIDIHIMITPDWLNLFYYLTTVPTLRQRSVDCLINLVLKKQLPPIKVETLTAMNLVGALPRIVETLALPTNEEEQGYLLDVVSFVVSTAGELLQCCTGSDTVSEGAHVMLHVVLSEVVKVFSISLFQAREISLPLVQQYIKSPLLIEPEAVELLHVIYRHTVLPDDVLLDPPDEYIDQRKNLHNLSRLIFRKYPHMVYHHCNSVVSSVVNVSDVSALPAAEAEAVMRYLYELGECFKMELLKDSTNDVAVMVNSLLCCETTPRHPHSAVHLAYFEVLDRYHMFFVHHRDRAPLVLSRFLLLPCGITNSNAKVRSRICYLFGHMLQVLKMQFAPHAENIVRALKENFSSATFTPSDKFGLYEGVGTLLSVSDMSVSASVADVIVCNLQETANYQPCESAAVTIADDIAFLSHFAKGLGGTEALRMPESPPLMSRDSATTGATFPNVSTLASAGEGGSGDAGVVLVFCGVTREVMKVLDNYHRFPLVRERICFFMHQIVNILPFSAISEFFEPFVMRILGSIQTANELPRVLRNVVPFVNKTRGTSVDLLARILPHVCFKVGQVGEVTMIQAVLGVVSEQTKEILEVYRAYFSLIHQIVHTSAIPCLLAEPAVQYLPKMLMDLVQAVRTPADCELPKQSFQILSRMCYQWLGVNTSFESFMLEKALPMILDDFTNPALGFNLHDAKNFFLVGELCQMIKTIVNKTSERGLCSVFSLLTSVLMQPQAEAFEVCNRLREDPRATAQFKIQFRGVLEAVQTARSSSFLPQ